MNEYAHLSDEESDTKINKSRANSYISTSRYHDYVAEKERREKEKQLAREKEKQKLQKEQYESVAKRLDKIIQLLELIGKHPWWASIIAFISAVIIGALADLLSTSVQYIISLISHK